LSWFESRCDYEAFNRLAVHSAGGCFLEEYASFPATDSNNFLAASLSSMHIAIPEAGECCSEQSPAEAPSRSGRTGLTCIRYKTLGPQTKCLRNINIGIIAFSLSFMAANRSFAQSQELDVFAVNTAFSGLSGAVGSVINKPKGSDWKKAFIKGLWQGGVGGVVAYSGKRSLYLINRYREVGYALPSRVLHYAGMSMIENAAQYRPLLDHWFFNYGLLRFDYSIRSRSFKARLLPYSLYSVYEASRDGALDLRTSLLTGSFAFRATGDAIVSNGANFIGLSHGNAFSYLDHPSYDKFEVIAHELVHHYQFEEGQIFNSWQIAFKNRVPKSIKTIFDKYVYADIPYHYSLYWLQDITHRNYNGNWFEFEAYRVSTSKPVLDR
jgi:hypothetical protein